MHSTLAKRGFATERFRGTLVVLHGISSRKEQMLTVCRWPCRAGFRCILYDSRGHGAAPPHLATFGKCEVPDLAAVRVAGRKASPRRWRPLGMPWLTSAGA